MKSPNRTHITALSKESPPLSRVCGSASDLALFSLEYARHFPSSPMNHPTCHKTAQVLVLDSSNVHSATTARSHDQISPRLCASFTSHKLPRHQAPTSISNPRSRSPPLPHRFSNAIHSLCAQIPPFEAVSPSHSRCTANTASDLK